jgi:hypothetical protein
MMARRCIRRRDDFCSFNCLELITSKRGFALSKVYSMRVPLRPVARSHVLQLLRRAAHGVLQALRESRERAARRIIEEHRHLLGK